MRTPPEYQKARLVVRGKVQGVGFRQFVRRLALELGLDGEVRNLDDGGVEVRAGGPSEAIRKLIGRVQVGPPPALVNDVEIEWEEGRRPARGFRITG